MNHIRTLLTDTDAGRTRVRLLGITLSNFEEEPAGIKEDRQLILPIFDD